VVIFVHSGDYDRLHEAFSIAATAGAANRPVDVVFSWFGLEALVRGDLERPHFPGRPELSESMADGAAPTVAELAKAARASGQCTFYGCTGSASHLGIRPDRLEAAVDHPMGWSSILQVTRGVVDRFSF
jgi:peroxiredoxin family protein